MDDGSFEGGLDDGGGFVSMVQNMGLIGALRTGDVKQDILIAMLIPVLFRMAISMIAAISRSLDPDWMKQRYRNRYYHQRRLVHSSGPGSISYNTEEDLRTYVLIKAILLYVHHNCNVQLRRADVEFTTMADSQDVDDYDDYDCHGNKRSSKKTAADVLQDFCVMKRPPEDEWHRIGFFGNPKAFVDLMLETDSQSDEVGEGKDKQKQITRTLELHLLSPTGPALDDFISKAHAWYMKTLRKKEDNSRYLYELDKIKEPKEGEYDYYGNEVKSGVCFKRYKLSDHKTFKTLFFKEKATLLKLLNDFASKGGKYSIEGYPYKLGLLLHGPPGTGKTSLIKALAQYTKRSIVNVPIAKVEKNSQLMSIFYDRKIQIEHEDVPIELEFEDVIYVMEDVDAASNVVLRRDGKKTADILQSQTYDAPRPKSVFQLLLESNDPTCRDLVEKLVEGSDRLRDYASQPDVVKDLCRKVQGLPGLSLIGHADETAALIGKQAVDQASPLMEQYETKDRFLAMHAEPLMSILDKGVELDDDLVDMLLGEGNHKLVGGVQHQVSYATFGGGKSKIAVDKKDDDGDDRTAALLRKMITGSQTESKTESKDDFSVFTGKKVDTDKLSLSGLLNVLDGVVDSPGRIVVMTSNHPEKLDPALIRPGRIDKRLKLSYMATTSVIEMLSHYFQIEDGEMTSDQKERIAKAIEGDVGRPKLDLTPAQVEQLTAEHEELEDMISALEAKVGIVRSKTGFAPISRASMFASIARSEGSIRFDA